MEIILRRDRRKPAGTHIGLTQPTHSSSVPVIRLWYDRYRLRLLPAKQRAISPRFAVFAPVLAFAAVHKSMLVHLYISIP